MDGVVDPTQNRTLDLKAGHVLKLYINPQEGEGSISINATVVRIDPSDPTNEISIEFDVPSGSLTLDPPRLDLGSHG